MFIVIFPPNIDRVYFLDLLCVGTRGGARCLNPGGSANLSKLSGLFWLPRRLFKFVRCQNSNFVFCDTSLNIVMAQQHSVEHESNFGFVAPQLLHAGARVGAQCHN